MEEKIKNSYLKKIINKLDEKKAINNQGNNQTGVRGIYKKTGDNDGIPTIIDKSGYTVRPTRRYKNKIWFNSSYSKALRNLGYNSKQIAQIKQMVKSKRLGKSVSPQSVPATGSISRTNLNISRRIMRQLFEKPMRKVPFEQPPRNYYESDYEGQLKGAIEKTRRVQEMGKVQEYRNRRIQALKRLLSQQANIMKAPPKIDANMDYLSTDASNNILKTPHLFSENNPNNVNLMKSNKLNVLQTREANNNLRFF